MQTDHYRFLDGGGEMGRLIAAYNWSATSLGPIGSWPESLCTSLSTILKSRFPMLIFWGKDLITFYNDAFRPSLGNDGKHPGSLGQRGEQSWAESWPVIGPMIYDIMKGGNAVWFEDQKLPLYREGKMGYAYWTYSFSAITNKNGDIEGLLVNCTETTKAVEGLQNLQLSKDELLFAIDAAELGTWDLNPVTGRFTANTRLKEWFGLKPDEEIALPLALDAIDEQDRKRVSEAIAYALDYKSGGRYNIEYTIINPKTQRKRLVLAKGRAWFGEDQKAYRFNGTLQDITEQKLAELAQKEAEARFKNVTNTAPTGLWLSDQEGSVTYLNKTLVDWTGLPYAQLLGAGWLNAIIEEHRERAANTFVNAIAARTHYKAEFCLRKGDGSTIWCRAEGDPFYDDKGNYQGYAGFCMDIHELKTVNEHFRKNEARFRALVEEAPVATCLFTGPDHKIEVANDMMLNVWGKTADVIGLPLIQAVPELKGQPFIGILDEIYRTGKPYSGTSAPAQLVVNGELQTFYFDFTYKPLFDENGEVYGIMDMAVNVTASVHARKAIEEAELFSRSVIENSPVAKIVFTGPDMVLKTVNRSMFDLLKKDESIIGKTYYDVFPELRESHMPETMRRVYTTGETFSQPEERIELIKDGKLQPGYYSYIYKALRNTEGVIYGIIVTATDITSQVLARHKVEEAEMKLSNAIELAELSTWSIDIKTKKVSYSPRLQQWLGLKEAVFTSDSARIAEEDRERVVKAIEESMQPGGKKFDEVYTIVNTKTGLQRIVHAYGRLSYDDTGQPHELVGVAQDVTLQRKLQLDLESEVQLRTEELAATNEELAATNEELADTNNSLMESNAELEQYAYVASHDLQEPLRKIQVFSTMLSSQEDLSATTKNLVDKISLSAGRMSLLIKDLLEFSRLLNSGKSMKNKVDLNKVVQEIRNDFELLIAEKGAIIEIDKLPVIEAVSLQMNQLFYNLVSNALKFVNAGVQPRIRISCEVMEKKALTKYIRKPAPGKTYYRLSVSDNGIGIDPKHSDQIFEVFKRLHGKNEYAGSGIGLALCRRIVNNHGGHLYSESEVGKGSVFHIILPE